MKKFILAFVFLLLVVPTVLFAEYILEPANCTLKKKVNCGAYLFDNKTGATFFCDLEKCKEIMPAIEVFATDEVKGSKKSKIPKFKKKKKSKIPKFKKKSE